MTETGHPCTRKASSVSRVMKHVRAHAKDPGHHETPLSAQLINVLLILVLYVSFDISDHTYGNGNGKWSHLDIPCLSINIYIYYIWHRPSNYNKCNVNYTCISMVGYWTCIPQKCSPRKAVLLYMEILWRWPQKLVTGMMPVTFSASIKSPLQLGILGKLEQPLCLLFFFANP